MPTSDMCGLFEDFIQWVDNKPPNEVNLGKSAEISPCGLGCAGASDCIEHYATCLVLWEYLSKAKPWGMGLPRTHRSLDNFLLAARGASQEQVAAMASHGVTRRGQAGRGEAKPEKTGVGVG